MRRSGTWLPRIAACALLALAAFPAWAQSYPSRPVQMVVGYAPGGLGDVVGRLLAEKLTSSLGRQVIVDNRPGASGGIAARLVARAEPDGHTLLVGQTAEIAINKFLNPALGYDPATDLQPIAIVGDAPLGLVVQAAAAFTSLQSMLDAAQAKPEGLSFASAGNGTPGHLAGELLRVRTNRNLLHVPYKGAGPALTDVIGGHVNFFFSSLPAALPHVKAGNLKVLAVSSARRSGSSPDLPTISEGGVADFDLSLWVGIFAPRGTPSDVVARLSEEIGKIIALPEMKERFQSQGLDVVAMSPEQSAAFVGSEINKYGRIIEQTGVKGE